MDIKNLVDAAVKALKSCDTSAIKRYIRRGYHSEYIFPSATNGLVGLSAHALFLRVKESYLSYDYRWLDTDESLGNILLHQAADISDYELAKLLLEKGADLASIDGVKRTALHIACKGESLEMIRLLAEKSPPHIFDLRDNLGHTPLDVARQLQGPAAVNILLSQGNRAIGKGERPVLVNALDNVRGYSMEITSLLLDAGANIDAADEYGKTPLLTAVRRSQCELRDAANYTARQNHVYTNISMNFINRGCDVNIPGRNGQIALHVAAEINHESLVRKLLISGSDIDRRDRSGFTPLYYACKNGNQRIVGLLAVCGANLRAEDWEAHFEMWRQNKELNDKNNQLLSYLICESKQLLSLEKLCNIAIRKYIKKHRRKCYSTGITTITG